MYPPRILFAKPFAISNLVVEPCIDDWTPPAAYELLVHPAWQNLLVHSTQRIWDGTYYRLLNPEQVGNGSSPGTLRLGTIRYRYVATFPILHEHHAGHQLEPLLHLSTLALLCTSDGYYLFGKRSWNGEIDLIGGGVQRDELAVATGADLERNLLKEIREETGISGNDIHQLSGIGILVSETSNVLIAAHANLALARPEALARFTLRTENEMSEPVLIPENMLASALRSMRGYRPLLSELMERTSRGLQ